VVSVTDPYGRILGFLDRSRYFSLGLRPWSLVFRTNLYVCHGSLPSLLYPPFAAKQRHGRIVTTARNTYGTIELLDDVLVLSNESRRLVFSRASYLINQRIFDEEHKL
jgi:hypothetical protein